MEAVLKRSRQAKDERKEYFMTTPLSTASPASVGFETERLNRLDGAMRVEIEAGHYAGISVMIARHGKLVKSECYGYQALGSSEPLLIPPGLRTRFHQKSRPKEFIMVLAEIVLPRSAASPLPHPSFTSESRRSRTFATQEPSFIKAPRHEQQISCLAT